MNHEIAQCKREMGITKRHSCYSDAYSDLVGVYILGGALHSLEIPTLDAAFISHSGDRLPFFLSNSYLHPWCH
jgi:hypothetical protein